MKKTIIVLFILFTIFTLSFVLFKNNNHNQDISNSQNNTQNQNVDTKTTYDFVYPKKVTQKREIIGKFVSNDVVSVYNRRDGIVQDILVDVGDKIKAGQVLATLFDVGVPGQAGANINEKSEILKARQIDLQNAINIKKQKINELNEKIKEQYTLLELALKNKDVKVNQIQNLLDNTYLIEDNSILLKKQAVEVEQKSLEVLEKNLEDALSSKESKLKDLENKKKQILDNSLVVIDKSFDEIIRLIYLGENREFGNNTFLDNNNISAYLSAKDSSMRNTFLQKVQDFYVFRKKFGNGDIGNGDIEELFSKLEEIYSLAPSVIDNTIISSNISQSLLDSFKKSIFVANSSLIKQKGDLENIINSYETVNKTEIEKINSLQNNISKQKEVIILKQKELELSLNSKNKTNVNLENELEKIKTSELSNIEAIKAKISVLQENLSLLKIQEQKNIDDIQNAINIAKSSLNTTISVYGNNKIISPFDGVISKRNINVGDMISSSMLAFEMVGVPTSLSKKANKEVVFNVPEEFKKDIFNGMEINFVSVNDTSTSYSGIIWRISPQVDSLNNTIQVQAKVDNDIPLPHNSNIRVFLNNDKNYLSIPFSSIYNKDGEKVVYFLRESGNLGYRKINIINEVGEIVYIEGKNLDESYKIVTTPLYFDN